MFKEVISSAAFAASQALSSQGVQVARSHLVEVIAASLGYGTHAALLQENRDTALQYHLDDAEVWVLNLQQARARAAALDVPGVVPGACADALRAASTIPVFLDIDTWWDEHVRVPLEDELVDADEVASVMAESNAYFPSSPDLDSSPFFAKDLWTSPDTWALVADGAMAGEFDPDDDHMITGDVIEIHVELSFTKAGRAGLLLLDKQVSADLRNEGDEDDENDPDDPNEAFERAMENPHA